MLKNTVRRIHKLRVFFFLFIVVAFLYSVNINPFDVTKYFGAKFTNAIGVGGSAKVQTNPFNSLALQLEQKEKNLDKRESSLDERENKLVEGKIGDTNKLLWVMIVGIFGLFVLLTVNFYLDWKRGNKKNKDFKSKI